MSHDIASADALLTENAALRERAERAEADAAALRGALDDLLHEVRHTLAGRNTRPDLGDAERNAIEVFAVHHPGAALIAEMEAARAVVAAARTGFGTEEDIRRAYAFDPNLLTVRIRAYDEAAKVRET